MTSKEALDNLSGLVNLDLCDLDEINNYVEIIEKDLEVLAIIKKYLSTDKFDNYLIDNDNISFDDDKKIKGWLNNGN